MMVYFEEAPRMATATATKTPKPATLTPITPLATTSVVAYLDRCPDVSAYLLRLAGQWIRWGEHDQRHSDCARGLAALVAGRATPREQRRTLALLGELLLPSMLTHDGRLDPLV
jgi:hypothetical protein